MKRPDIPAAIQHRFSAIHDAALENKYYFDKFNEAPSFAGGARVLGKILWRGGDVGVIDGIIVNGSAKLVGWVFSDPPVPDRLCLSLRFHHDHRALCIDDAVDQPCLVP